jgi:hypothetical protein
MGGAGGQARHDEWLRAAMVVAKVLRQIVPSRAPIPASVCKTNSVRDDSAVCNRFPAAELAVRLIGADDLGCEATQGRARPCQILSQTALAGQLALGDRMTSDNEARAGWDESTPPQPPSSRALCDRCRVRPAFIGVAHMAGSPTPSYDRVCGECARVLTGAFDDPPAA